MLGLSLMIYRRSRSHLNAIEGGHRMHNTPGKFQEGLVLLKEAVIDVL